MNVDAVDEHTLTRLANVLQTLREMLEDRHYDVSAIDWPSVDEVQHWSDFEKLTFALPSLQVEHHWIMVFFPNEAKIGVNSVRDMVAAIDESQVESALVIVREGLTPTAKTELMKALSSRKHEKSTTDASTRKAAGDGMRRRLAQRVRQNVDIFTYDELQTNITLHEWVPPHIVLTKAEKQAVCKSYRVRDDQLPGISVKDPIARYYGLKRGQMVFIIRPSESAGSVEYYRIVRY